MIDKTEYLSEKDFALIMKELGGMNERALLEFLCLDSIGNSFMYRTSNKERFLDNLLTLLRSRKTKN
jgi:hypothetical protein